jgi:hypothetical protein
MIRIARMSSALLLLAACAPSWAQQEAVTPAPQVAPASLDTTLPAAGHVLPANATVELEITEAISSKARKRGERFALRLRAPVVIDGMVALPAGIPGVGEIIHADRARGGGKPGELLLAARYLEYAGMRIPLRGFRVGANGKDHSKAALATAVALGPFAQFIHGGEVEIPAATTAQARLAADIVLPPEPMAPDAIDAGQAAAATAPAANPPPAPPSGPQPDQAQSTTTPTTTEEFP